MALVVVEHSPSGVAEVFTGRQKEMGVALRARDGITGEPLTRELRFPPIVARHQRAVQAAAWLVAQGATHKRPDWEIIRAGTDSSSGGRLHGARVRVHTWITGTSPNEVGHYTTPGLTMQACAKDGEYLVSPTVVPNTLANHPLAVLAIEHLVGLSGWVQPVKCELVDAMQQASANTEPHSA